MNNTTYSTGTVSVGTSSTTVTGVGTAWLNAGIRAGDLIMLAGLVVRIASVNSATALTLSRPWPGAAQSGVNYDILMLDDEVRSLAAANILLQTLGNGTLTSLAGLASAPDKLPWFSGPNSMALTDLTGAARSLLGSTMLSASGSNLVTAASARVTGGAVVASPGDMTSGLLVTTGWMGIGGSAINHTETHSFDSLPTNATQVFGNGSVSAVPSGVPVAGAAHVGLQMRATSTRHVQIVADVSSATANNRRLWWRSNNNGWRTWRSLLDSGDILGTVAMAGGAPSGALMEYNANANGEYWRFANGLQLCARLVDLDGISLSTASGSLFRNSVSFGPYPYPAAFVGTPLHADVTLHKSDNSAISTGAVSVRFRRGQTGAALAWDGISILSTASATGTAGEITRLSLFAIGKWA